MDALPADPGPSSTALGGPDGGPSRRDVLRWAGAVGAAALVPTVLAACEPLPGPPAPSAALRTRTFVGGSEAEVGPGAWCWFQSPRATMGPGGQLWLGSQVANTGTSADGDITVTRVDLANLGVTDRRILQKSSQDDHTSPSLLALGNQVHVAWALHRRVDHLDLGLLTPGQPFRAQRIRRPGSLTGAGRGMAYASVHLVGGQLWLLYRGEQFSWNLLTSPDAKTWTAKGLVVAPGGSGQRPYLQASSSGSALTFVVTDGNPTEFPGNSVWTGSIGTDLKVRTAGGTVVGAVGSTAPKPSRLTRLLRGAAAGAGEADDVDHWLADLQHVDNRPTGILTTREPWPADGPTLRRARFRYHWIRQRPSGWLVEPLCWGGSDICDSTTDYSGLAAQDPTDPKRVVVSTNVDPASGEPLPSIDGAVPRFELFEGYRVGEGRWSWTPLTEGSTEDNLRPVITAGGDHKALSWMRGTYWAWTNAATRLVVRRSVNPA